ncbi:alpha/beta fold hydrolase [Erwinia sp. CGal63]|uniref:alpha/beta fold hydrolase n=1 Tax=Erwinia sp. CGal63 TaxID=2919889 RepID=UPI0030092099
MARCFTNHRVYCIDGIADEEDPCSAFDAFNTYLHAFLSGRKTGSVTLIGYSMGGFAAQYFTSRYPDAIDSLVLLGSCRPTDHEGFCYASSAAFTEYLFTLPMEDIYRIATWNLLSPAAKNDLALMATLRDAFLRDPPSKAACMNQLGAMAHLMHQRLHYPAVPCLSIYALQDLVIKPTYSLRSGDADNIEMKAVEGGHLFLYENPAEVFRLISAWLKMRSR